MFFVLGRAPGSCLEKLFSRVAPYQTRLYSPLLACFVVLIARAGELVLLRISVSSSFFKFMLNLSAVSFT